MSKLTKLLKHPRLFVRDAINNRRNGHPAKDETAECSLVQIGPVPTYVFGFSPWKQFLKAWFPERELFFLPKTIKSAEFNKVWKAKILSDRRSEIFIWGFKVERYVTRFAAANGIKCVFVEDGFIRSIGLGATKAPPFSLTLDYQTPYFNARAPSDLECLLSTYDFDVDPGLLERADRLMQILLQSGISKYNHATPVDINEIYGPKTGKRVLVVGQVEDDASIQYGSARAYSNNDAVLIAAIENPDAQIIYKPHPDVMNKHREMRSNPDDVRHVCMVLERDVPLAQAFETVDHVYTITSQAGFEALMRGIHVTTLGCPFYSGWGLTDDRQPNERRTRKLTLQQVFAAAYLLYPRYFDSSFRMKR
jgi:capsule polysaccharide export protein KpsC/LpsZ